MSFYRNLSVIVVAFLAVGLFSIPIFAASVEDGIAAYVAGNFQKAFEILKPLAIAGDPRAQYYLGEMYYQGQGVSKNHDEAFKWFSKAAEQGYNPAKFKVQIMLKNK
jgi:TPR repeat protein